jgi:hypothetical protein
MMERAGFEQLLFRQDQLNDKIKDAEWLRSWVQLPPGPFLSVMKVRHWFEFNLDNCRTNPAATLMLHPILSHTSSSDIMNWKLSD